MGRTRIVSLRGRGPRRSTLWLASADVTDKQALAAGVSIFDQSFAFNEPATIIRTRGSVWVGVDQQAANEEPFGALGFTIASDAAAAVGIGSLETPITEESSDNWFVWLPWLASIEAGDGTGFTPGYMERYDFDSKAMRKVDDGDTAVVVMENASAADGCVYIIKFRMLVKLHG